MIRYKKYQVTGEDSPLKGLQRFYINVITHTISQLSFH